MSKIKTILVYLLVPFSILAVIIFIKIKNKEEVRQKTVLAKDLRKGMENLMLDLIEARKSTILDAPADGQWHDRIIFFNARQGALEYLIKNGQLVKAKKGRLFLIADNIHDFRVRRQQSTPDIVEVQIQAQKNVSLISNLKIRIRE